MSDKTNKDSKDKHVTDSDLWAAVTKGIKRLNPERLVKSDKVEKPKNVKEQPMQPITQSDYKPTSIEPEKTSTKSRDIDKNTLDRLRKGKLAIEGRIDLHGMTQMQAEEALKQFLRASYDADKRCVLVITGKGTPKNTDEELGFWSRQTSGVLKQRLPDWLYAHDMSDIVLKHVRAQGKHGGGGAFYVYLRRRRG